MKWRQAMFRSRREGAREVARERGGQRIRGHDPARHVDDHRGNVRQPVEQALQARGEVAVDGAPTRLGLTPEPEQMSALVIRQPQRPGQGVEHRRRWARGAALLEAGEVVD